MTLPVPTSVKTANKSFQSFRSVARVHLVQILGVSLGIVLVASSVLIYLGQARLLAYKQQMTALQTSIDRAEQEKTDAQTALEQLQNEDPRKINNALRADMAQLKATYTAASSAYNSLVALRERSTKTGPQDSLFASVLSYLAKDNDASAEATLKTLAASIAAENAKLDVTVAIPANVTASNTAPGSGFSRQKVTVDGSDFLIDIVAADLNSTRVIIDTASDSTCPDNCPVLPLADYVARSGAYAGVNGSYFCPDTYPDCASKKNAFDTLLMNKNKVYFNSDNNVYSTVPAVIFSGNSMRLVSASQQWGRDTGVDAVIANRPMLVQGGNIAFTGSGETKEAIRGNRAFVGATGNTGYIGVLHGVTVAEGAKVLHALGVHDAINLDSGGSTAMWANGGYKDGPGRNLPNVVLFVRK
ncbi:MAG TPA: phosphodiester glycosidase family protein [Candidatus Saccharimonadia bacterium]|nr:phosphodiester glycosidase family protein [Candidatus Saccharimonadia bacterium]